jgi:hypothetical protein
MAHQKVIFLICIISPFSSHCSDKNIYNIGFIKNKSEKRALHLVAIDFDVAILYKIHIFKHQFLLNPIEPFRESKSLALAKLVLSPNPFAKLSHAPGADVG